MTKEDFNLTLLDPLNTEETPTSETALTMFIRSEVIDPAQLLVDQEHNTAPFSMVGVADACDITVTRRYGGAVHVRKFSMERDESGEVSTSTRYGVIDCRNKNDAVNLYNRLASNLVIDVSVAIDAVSKEAEKS